MQRHLFGGGVLTALWFLFGWAPHLLFLAGGRIAALGGIAPMPMYGVHGSPAPWAVLVQALTALALVTGFALILSFLARGRSSVPSSWLAAILTALVIGVAHDLGNFVARVGTFGLRSAAMTLGTVSEPMVYWAVLVGWIPALVLMRRTVDASATRETPGRQSRIVLALTLVAALVAIPIAAQAGRSATQELLRLEEAERAAQADPEGAAYPDPNAPGEAVPTIAPAEGMAPVDACDNENSILLAPAADAFTGHRLQRIEILNTSEEPCTVNGYPDVAYGDQNGHLLDVTIERGSPFGGQDPGPQLLTIEPMETAFAQIGWSASSVHGELAARELWIAVRAGVERSTWPVSMDIIPGATVTVSAWQEPAP